MTVAHASKAVPAWSWTTSRWDSPWCMRTRVARDDESETARLTNDSTHAAHSI